MEIKYEECSEILKALGHPIRLKMVEGLMGGDGCNVNKIVDNIGIPQSTVSQHLKVLKMAGVISFRKEGVRVCYSVTNKKIVAIMKLLKR